MEAIERALVDLCTALVDCQSFEVEAGCSGEGPLVKAFEALGRDLPDELKEWLKQGDIDADF